MASAYQGGGSMEAAQADGEDQRGAMGAPLAKYLLLSLLSIVCTLLVLEGILRMSSALGLFPSFFQSLGGPAPRFSEKTGPGLYYADPYTSYGMKPGYRNSQDDVSINSLGFRGPETTREKPAGTFRIVAMGGSTTYGIWLDDNQTYPAQLQDRLRKMFGSDRIEVINTGLVSATTAENMHRMFSQILPLQPDMIIYYEGYNDLVPRIFDDFTDDYYNFRKTPQDSPDFSQFMLYRLALRALARGGLTDNANLLPHIWKFENLPATDRGRIANFRATSAATYKRNLEDIILLAEAKHIQVALGTFAFQDDLRNWNDVMPDVLWGQGIAQNNQAVEELASQYDLPLMDFHAYAAGHPELFIDSIHVNANGAREQAAFFAETLAPLVSAKTGLSFVH